jgi:hypothetical protein
MSRNVKHGLAPEARRAGPQSRVAAMAAKLCTAGREGPYRLCKQVVEPVFGQIRRAWPGGRAERMVARLHRPQSSQACRRAPADATKRGLRGIGCNELGTLRLQPREPSLTHRRTAGLAKNATSFAMPGDHRGNIACHYQDRLLAAGWPSPFWYSLAGVGSATGICCERVPVAQSDRATVS